MIFVSLFLRILRHTLPAAIGWFLGRELGVGAALAICAALAIVLPTTGALLLNSLKVGQVDWRNYAAGWLMPFGYSLGRGKLVGMVIACAAIWFAISVAGVLLSQPGLLTPTAPAATTPAAPSGWAWPTLIAGWVVLGAIFVHMLGTLHKNFSGSSSGGRELRKLLGFVVVLVAVSALLHVFGSTRLAALVAIGPPAAVGGLMGLWVLMILIIRPKRWN